MASSASSLKNELIHHVNENFDFEQKIFDIETSNYVKTTHISINSPNSSAKNSNNPRKSSINVTDKQSATFSSSPSKTTPSYFNSNFDENGYVFDGIKIDIEDIDNTSVSNITTQSLKRCKSQVLNYYYGLLCFIGWRQFYKEHYYRTPCCFKILNVVYPLLIVSLLFYAYAHDIVTCQPKLNIFYDTQYIAPATLAPAMTRTTKLQTTINASTKNLDFNFGKLFDAPKINGKSDSTILSRKNKNSDMNEQKKVCGHIVTTYIIPSLLHFIAYIIGFIYFRINENEQLYALMEKVFLAVNQTLKVVSQDKVIKRLKIFILLGVIWVIIAVTTYVLSRIAFDLEVPFFTPQWLSILIEVLALIIVNSIYLAVVINHSTQCEMIIFYVNEIKTRLEEKSITLKEAMQQILDIRMAIGNLNSTISKMTTLVSLNFIEKLIIGLIILIMNRVLDPLMWVYRILFTLSWFLILTLTLTQIARLNSVCCKFKQIALASRVYGYHASSRDELDSFLLFIANAKLRAKLFGIPLRPSVILATLIIISFTLIILFQSSVIATPDSII